MMPSIHSSVKPVLAGMCPELCLLILNQLSLMKLERVATASFSTQSSLSLARKMLLTILQEGIILVITVVCHLHE